MFTVLLYNILNTFRYNNFIKTDNAFSLKVLFYGENLVGGVTE